MKKVKAEVFLCVLLVLSLNAAVNATEKNRQAQAEPKQTGESRRVRPYLDMLGTEDQRRLMKLYQDNPAAYFNELSKIVNQLRREESELNQQLAIALNDYRAAIDEETRSRHYENIVKITRQQFFFRLRETEQRLIESEQRLMQLRKLYETRKKNAESIIEKRIQFLISDPSQRW